MLLSFIVICLFNFTVKADVDDLDLQLKSSVASISESFNNLMEDIKNFFKCKFQSILHRKSVTKNAFYKFISESTNKSLTKKCGEDRNTRTLGKEKMDFVPKADKHGDNEQMDIIKLVGLHGFRLETHTTLTADGYTLMLHRILFRDSDGKEMKKVLLHHGLLGSSEDWMLLGSKKALPYLLWMSGYDVWLTNARGNKYSKVHTRLPADSADFWDFSFHEIGIYDLPAAIDYIKEIGDSKAELHYIGYSMGATSLLVLLSTYPQYNNIFKSAILLAPLAFMYNVKGTFRYFSDMNKYGFVHYLGNKEFQLNSSIPKQIFTKYCVGDPQLCLKPIFLLTNGGKHIPNLELSNVIKSRVSGEGSAKTIRHYIQLVNSGQFQMFDYGHEENLKKYGMPSPPSYRLNDVTLPVAIITSTDDWLCTISDTASLLPFLSNPIVHHVIKRNQFSHTDFLFGEDAPQLVYNLIIDILLDPKSSRFQNDDTVRNFVLRKR
ncbi:lipase 3-like [Amyelois transitella]|uniref:lipase 3-like n=1 Tax=Amyelois transitella TaxID=680683 RepID=UPI00298FC003|nr:lipase 3-like [Amyelois transitella]